MSTSLKPGAEMDSRNSASEMAKMLSLQCTVCGNSLGEADVSNGQAAVSCTSCGFVLASQQGIWNALAPKSAVKFQQFMEEYQTVRRREGREWGSGSYYLALPFKDITKRNSWQWRIRARSFRFFARTILPAMERRRSGGLDVLDIGAGNCWLSYRLALRGHRPVAVDLLVNDFDGLGAAHHYFNFLPRKFHRFQAEMDRLPFAAAQFDVVIFNASFHYSEDYGRTVSEVLRCLRRPGHIVIMDSPFYYREQSGRKMVEERRASFEKMYGFKSDSIASREYLTPGILDNLRRTLGSAWKTYKPWYGFGWSLRPIRAWVMRRREPAKFYIVWGTAVQA